MPALTRLRVLIVEDVVSDAKLNVQLLRRDGVEVEWSRVDTEAAYLAALNPDVDVVLSDSRMPLFSGARAIELLGESGLDIPLIIVSGTIGEEAAAELIRRGAADYVSKDKPMRLSMAISRALAEVEVRRARKRAIDDLHRADTRFRALFESNVIGIIVTDGAGRILEANAYFLSMVHRSSEDLPLDWAAMTPPEFLSTDRDMLRELERTGSAVPWEKELFDTDGNRIPILIGSAKLADQSFVCFVVDLTQIKAVQANLEHAKVELEKALYELKTTQDAMIAEERLHALGQMAAGIAHDFNNSLSPIVGLSELILTRSHLVEDHETVLKYVRTIYQAGRDAALVVSRLRDFYREDGRSEQVELVDLVQVVEDTIELTRSRWADQAMATNTKYHIITRLEGATVAGRASELREMLVNIIFNALDAMPDGGDLSVGVGKDPDRAEMVQLEVQDTGTGMTAEVRKRCLEPFFTTKGATGTGLGLATSYGTIKRHHGEIQIDSEPGRGTRIVVSLPIAARDRVIQSVVVQARAGPALRILLVDDDDSVRNAIAEYLRADGHAVDLADRATTGLSKIKTGHYDLIITDRAMPEMSGDHLALASKRVAPAVPILMLTGFGDFMNGAHERPQGVDVVASKPITISGLRDAIAKATGREPALSTAD